MANDFYVEFGSNAQQFAESLNSALAPAEARVTALQTAIESLNRATSNSGFQKQLAARLPAEVAGTGVSGGNAMLEHINAASDELQHVMANLGTLTTRLSALPDKVSNIMRSIEQRINMTGRGGQQDPLGGQFTGGNLSSQEMLRRRVDAAVKGSVISLAPGQVSGRNLPQPGISTITKAQLDTAALDRVVSAIQEQTRQLLAAERTVRVAPGTAEETAATSGTSSKSRKSATAAVAADERDEAALQGRLESITGKINQVMAALGADLGTGAQELLAELKAEQAAVEREISGMSRGEQSAARRSAAQQLRDEDAQRRYGLIQGAATQDLSSRSVTKANLREMAEALKSVGFDVPYTSKTNKGDLASMVGTAATEYKQQYGDLVPEQLRGKLPKADTIDTAVKTMLGDVNGHIAEYIQRQTGFDILRQDLRGGGVIPTQHLAGGMNSRSKGQVQYGSGTLGPEVQGERIATPEEIDKIRAAISKPIDTFALAVERSRQGAGFNPYQENLGEGISGSGTTARAYRSILQSLRTSTTALDEMGHGYLENAAFIDRARTRAEMGTSKPGDAEKMDAAWAQIEKIPDTLQSLFASPKFQEGLAARQQPRADYEAAVKANQGYTYTPHAVTDIMQGLGQALGGTKTAIGSRLGVKAIPGLAFSQTKGFVGDQLDPKVVKDLNDGLLQYSRALNKSQQSPEDAKAASRLESAATRLANALQKGFGVSPHITTLGVANPSEEALAAQAKRDVAAQKVALTQGTRTPEQQQERANNLVTTYTNQLAAAREKAAKAAVTVADEEQKLATKLAEANSAEGQANKARYEEIQAAREEALAKRSEVEAEIRLAKELRDESATVASGRALRGTHSQSSPEEQQAAQQTVDLLDKHISGLNERLNAINVPVQEVQPTDQQRYAQIQADKATLTQQKLDASREGDLKENAGYQAAVQGLENLEKREAALYSRLGGKIDEAKAKLDAAQAEVTRLSEALTKAKEKAATAGSAIEKKASAETKEAEATQQAATADLDRIATLKAERSALQQQPHTKGDIKGLQAQADEALAAISGRRGGALQGAVTRAANVGDSDKQAAAQAVLDARRAEAATAQQAVETARAAQARIGVIGKELTALGAGGKGGGRVPPTARGASDGGAEDNILRQILAALNSIHSTIRSGVKVTGSGAKATETAADGTTTTTPKPRSRNATVTNTQDLKEAARLQREQQASMRLDEETAKTQRMVEQQVRRVAQAELDAARDAQQYATAMAYLTENTKAEIAALEQMIKAGASAHQIVSQQNRVYAGINNDMSRFHQGVTSINDTARSVFSQSNPGISSSDIQRIQRSAQAENGWQQVGADWASKTQSGFARLFSGTSNTFWGRTMHTTGTFLVRNFSAGLVFGLTNALQTAITDAVKTQQTFVRLSSTLASTGKDVGNLRTDLQATSSDYGVALNDMYDTAAKLAGVFSNSDQLAGATKAVAQLQAISEGALSAQESVGAISSIWSAFQDQLSKQGGAEHISDVATALQNLTGTNIEDTVEGVARLAGMAKQMGISFEETATFVAQISKETNTSGATAGEQLSRILEQMQGSQGQAVLKQAFGGDLFTKNTINGAVNYGNVLKDMISNWDHLSKSQQQAVTHTVAGSRQAATFAALMDNGARTMNNLAKAEDSTGAAQTRMAKLMETINGQFSRFKTNFHNLVNELVQMGFLDFLGLAMQDVNDLLKLLDGFLAEINKIADANGVIGFFVHMGAAVTGTVVAIRLLQGAYAGLKETMAQTAIVQNIQNANNGRASVAAMFGFGGKGGGAAADAKAAGAADAAAASYAELAATNRQAAEAQKAATARVTAAEEALAAAQAEAAVAARIAAAPSTVAHTTSSAAARRGASAEEAALLGSTAAANASLRDAAAKSKVYIASEELAAAQKAETAATVAATAATKNLAAAKAAQDMTAAEQLVAETLDAQAKAQAALDTASAEYGAALQRASRGLTGATEESIAAEAKVRQARLALATASEEAAAAAELGAAEGALGGAAGGIGMMGRLKGFSGKLLSPGMLVGGMVLGDALSSQHGAGRDVGETAAAGALMGSAFGVPGVVIGGAAGAIVGMVKASHDEAKAAAEATTAMNSLNGELGKLPTGAQMSAASAKQGADKINAFLGSDTAKGLTDTQRTALQRQSAYLTEVSNQIDNYIASFPTQHLKSSPITSFDTDTLNNQLQTLSTRGQSASQVLDTLNRTLEGTGQAAKVAQGTFGTIGGKPNNDLSLWANTQAAGADSILRNALGTNGAGLTDQMLSQGLGLKLGSLVKPQTISIPTGGYSPMTGLTMSNVQLAMPGEKGNYKVHNTGQAINQAIAYYMQQGAANGLDPEAMSKLHDALVNYFSKQLTTYKDMAGSAKLTNKDAMNLINEEIQLGQQAASDLPQTDLPGKVANAKQTLDSVKNAIAKTLHGPTSQMLVQLQNAKNAYAEAQLAQLDATRQAAQRNATSQSQIYAAGMNEARKAVQIAARTGDVDMLATVIDNAGQAGLDLVKQMIAQEKNAIAAYKQQIQTIMQVASASLASIGDGALQGYEKNILPNAESQTSGIKKQIRAGQKKIDAWQKAIDSAMGQMPSGTKNSPWLSGSDVPGIAQAQGDAAAIRKDQQALIQARLQSKEAYDQAHGFTVAAAKVEVQIAKASIAAGKQDLANAKTMDDRLQAEAEIISARGQLATAIAGVAQAQDQLIASKFDVRIANADANGNSVRSANLKLQQATTAYHRALKEDGGRNTQTVNEARASMINAQASAQQAALQDQLDTINFNQQMGKMTSSAAIQALEHILKTEKLTRDQRRSLLLQIKGMKDSMADSQWNIGDIKLPTPYQMKRYIQQRKDQMTGQMDAAAKKAADAQNQANARVGASAMTAMAGSSSVTNNQTTIYIDGADIAKVRKVIEDVVGKSARTKITSGRRRAGG